MSRIRALVISTLVVLLVCSCTEQRKTEDTARNPSDVDPGMIPRLRLDIDTIQLGDSLTGIIGAVFKSSITEKQRQLIIATISYRIDTTETELGSDAIFHRSGKLNDSTFRFSIFSKNHPVDFLSKQSFYASINVQFYSADNNKQVHTFTNRFEYYIKSR